MVVGGESKAALRLKRDRGMQQQPRNEDGKVKVYARTEKTESPGLGSTMSLELRIRCQPMERSAVSFVMSELLWMQKKRRELTQEKPSNSC